MILAIMGIFLALPTVYEISDDAEGDLNKKRDVIYRLLLMISMAFVAHLTGLSNFFVAFNLSLAIHFLFFDYIIQYILIKNGTLEPPKGVTYHWFTYQAKSGVIDNLRFWRNMNKWVKLGIKLAYFTISLILFIK
jgi:hypothetical protein